MTDEQIVKALECCVRYENHMACRGCPFNESGVCEADGLALQKHSLFLIKRQQAEIERLKQKAAEIQLRKEMYRVTVDEIKAEAVREFAEKLKDIYTLHDGLQMTIDNLVREMTEEKK